MSNVRTAGSATPGNPASPRKGYRRDAAATPTEGGCRPRRSSPSRSWRRYPFDPTRSFDGLRRAPPDHCQRDRVAARGSRPFSGHDLHFAAVHENAIRPESRSRVREALTGSHVVLPAMERARHDIAVEEALAERAAAMEARVVSRVERATDVEYRHRATGDDDDAGLARRDFADLDGNRLHVCRQS